MEEKILFEIQRFADTETISAGQSATIDGITYTAKKGNVTIDVDTSKKSARRVTVSSLGLTVPYSKRCNDTGATPIPSAIAFCVTPV